MHVLADCRAASLVRRAEPLLLVDYDKAKLGEGDCLPATHLGSD
jgi:hypothetical protein